MVGRVLREVEYKIVCTVEPCYNEVLGTMKITLLYQVSHYVRVKTEILRAGTSKMTLLYRGFCYIRSLYNEVRL